MVLQVMDARDISSPKRASGSSGRRMLRLDLTDGDATVVAVEYRELTSVEDASALAPGTKVAVPPGVRIRCQSGILLAHGDALRVLGGKVAALAEEWEGGRAVAVFDGNRRRDARNRRSEVRDVRPGEGGRDRGGGGRGTHGGEQGRGGGHRGEEGRLDFDFNFNREPRAGNGARAVRAAAASRAAPDPRAASRRSGRGREAPASRRSDVLHPRGDGDRTDRGARGRAGDVAWAELHRTRSQRSHTQSKERGGRGGPDSVPAVPARVFRAAPEEEATAPVDPPPAPAPAFAPTVTEEDRRSRLLSRFASDSREGRGSRDRGREDRGRGDRDHGRGDRDRGRGGRGGRREGERRGGGGRRGGDEERDDGFRTLDRTASGSRTEDDEALARQLQRDLELEDSGYVATDAAALAASLFSFPAREQEREDSGRRGRR